MSFIKTLFQRAPLTVLSSSIAGGVSGVASTGLLALINSAIWEESGPGSYFLWSFLGLCLLAPAANLVSLYLLQRLGQGEVYKLRTELSRQVLATPLSRLEELGPPKIMSVLTNDIGTISNSVAVIPVMVINGAIATACLVYMASISLKLFGILMVLFVFGVVTYHIAFTKCVEKFNMARRIDDRLLYYFRGLTEGTKELMLSSPRREAFVGSLGECADSQRGLRMTANMILGGVNAWGQLLTFVVIGGLLLFGQRMGGVDHPDLARYVVVLIYIMTPLQVFLNTMPQLGQANAAVSKIDEMGFSLRPSAMATNALDDNGLPDTEWRALKLDSVTYSYTHADGEDGRYEFSLGPIDLEFQPGSLVFLIGGNGCGKTSLAKLLLGFYSPESGSILLDGTAINPENNEGYQRYFSAVFSDFFLFDELLGVNGADVGERVKSYLKELNLEKKVRLEDGAWSTTSLSQGQRKRLALLVAYLEDRQIYLFDEWAADQDPAFKNVFYEALLPELKNRGKTVFVISHDDHYYRVADRIIKMSDGQVEFDGDAQRFMEQYSV